MTDVLTKQQRSYNMSKIRSKNTKPELFIFNELEKQGLVFEKHYSLPGQPDVAFVKNKVVVFIDGEFWHGRNLPKIKYRLTSYWIEKITKNIKRDRSNRKLLRAEGWKVIRLWGDEIKKNPSKAVNKIIKALG